jgi:DNA-binding XRE family transcriptional regulator
MARKVPLPKWIALIRLREELGLTRPDFAEKIGVSRHCVVDVELGRRKGEEPTIRALADFFGCTVEELTATRDLGEDDPLPTFRRTPGRPTPGRPKKRDA